MALVLPEQTGGEKFAADTPITCGMCLLEQNPSFPVRLASYVTHKACPQMAEHIN